MIEARARGSITVLDTKRLCAELVCYLELVFAGLGLRCWIEEIHGENL